MILDVTGIFLTPGDSGNACAGNGAHRNADGTPLECCCDECDYYLTCFPAYDRLSSGDGIA